MESSGEDELVLRLTIEHLKEAGGWPKLQDLHQRIHQELQLKADVQATARRLDRKPFVGGGYSHLGETFAPPLRLIARDEQGYRLLQGLVDYIGYAKEKYESFKGQPEVTSQELSERFDLDVATLRAVRELMHSVPSASDGGGSNDGGWTVRVADEIVSWPDELTPEKLLAEVDRREQEHQTQAAEMARAHHAMIDATRKAPYAVAPMPSEPPSEKDAVGWLESHPIIRGVLLVGAVVGAVTIIVGWIAKIL